MRYVIKTKREFYTFEDVKDEYELGSYTCIKYKNGDELTLLRIPTKDILLITIENVPDVGVKIEQG